MAPTVLITEDDADLCALIEQAFTLAGFQVLRAQSGTQALEILESGVPDALVVDATLPGISGLNIIRRVRRSPTAHKLNILLITGDEKAIVSPEAGLADMVLLKPISLSRLVTQARRMIDTTVRTESNGINLREQIRAQMK